MFSVRKSIGIITKTLVRVCHASTIHTFTIHSLIERVEILEERLAQLEERNN